MPTGPFKQPIPNVNAAWHRPRAAQPFGGKMLYARYETDFSGWPGFL